MKISKYLHSCIVLEKEGTRLLFDPGAYSFVEGLVKPADFKNISGIFITHNHPDHYDAAALKTIVSNNPGTQIFSNPMTGELLREEGLPLEIFDQGEKKIALKILDKILSLRPQDERAQRLKEEILR